MKPTIDVDLSEWKKAARELFETSSRSAVDFTNGQALKVASDAIKLTKTVDDRRIEYELGVVGTKVKTRQISRGKNKGKTKLSRGGHLLASDDTLAHRILFARKNKTGSFGTKGETMEDIVQAFIRGRVASSSFVRSGWIPAVKRLIAVVRKKPVGSFTARNGARQRGREKGTARPAVFSLTGKIVAEIQNDALNALTKYPSLKGNPMVAAKDGLSKALKSATQDMIETLAKRLKQDLAKFGAK